MLMKSKVARILSLSIASLLLILVLVGCGRMLGKPSETTTPDGTSASTDRPDNETDAYTESPSLSESNPIESDSAETTADTFDETIPATDVPTEPESETEPDDGTDAPKGYIRLYTAEELLDIRQQCLSCEQKTYSNGKYAYISCKPTDLDPWFRLANSERTAVKGAKFLRIKYRTSTLNTGRLFLGERGISEEGALFVPFTADGEWHTATIDLTMSAAYSENLRHLRFDPMDGVDLAAEQIDIAWIAAYPPTDDPSESLPPLPEDAPNLDRYEKMPDGSAYYTVTGALSGSDGTYTFKENFKLNIYRRGYFNRYTIGYSSTSPIRGEITYLLWDANGEKMTYTEEFFLEAGNDRIFSSLIDGYFRHTYAWGISSIKMKTCDGSTATFTIQSVKDDCAEVLPGTYYLENDRYKLGIILNWGGGISYIEDKKDGDSGITNLINRADPGRLVQQSYYGIKNGSGYTPGYYNGTEWRYNPVQGGDVSGHGSKLVDVRILEDGRSIYIKCRPMDWAKSNEPTPSYMENTYTLEKDFIRVGNRFVDFFGVKHPAYHAELPAFYTISHLGTFHYYNGSKPWTNDTVTTLPNEPFWAGNKNAYHDVVKGNTETWAAWTNKSGYGIGLYVPGTETFLAGRYEYNGSKDPANGGTSYVAPLRTMTIVSFVPFEYEYIIAAGTVQEMRQIFYDYTH